MTILGVDTATPTASVALVDDEELLAEEILGTTTVVNGAASTPLRGIHAEIILPLIELVLRKARITLADLSGIAVSIGPGSFTGLRIGLATVKGIAYDWGVPAVGISTLLANATRVKQFDGIICSLLDARKGEVYVGLYRRSGDVVSRLTADAVTSIESAIELVRSYYNTAVGTSLFVIGDGAKAYEKVLIRAFGTGVLRISAGDGHPSVASKVAELAQKRVGTDSLDDLGALVPIYLRRPEAENKR